MGEREADFPNWSIYCGLVSVAVSENTCRLQATCTGTEKPDTESPLDG